jgi:hypothetical protein
MPEPKSTQLDPQAFEKELMDLLSKHHVTRFAAVFSDPDRHPYLIDRFVHSRSGAQWAMGATLQLAAKIRDMVSDGRLKAADDPENQVKPHA